MNSVPHLPAGRKLQQAIAALELMSQPEALRVLHYLQQLPEATFIDILIGTELDTEVLRTVLADLCRLNLVFQEGYDGGMYTLQTQRLNRIIPLIRSIAKDPWEETVSLQEEMPARAMPLQV